MSSRLSARSDPVWAAWPARIVVCMLIAIVAAGILLGFPPGRSGGPMLIVAHRGDIQNWPENTLEGVVAAAQAGADGVEFDVIRAADDTWHLLHDLTVDRTTDQSGPVAELSAHQIEGLQITGGFGFDPARHGDGLGVPRLERVLDALRSYRGVLIFDVKGATAEAHGELAELILARNLVERVHVNCSVSMGCSAVKEVDPRIQTVADSHALKEAESTDDIDSWVADIQGEMSWRLNTWLRRTNHIDAVVPTEYYGLSEAAWLRKAHEWGARQFLTNDLGVALKWSPPRPGPSAASRTRPGPRQTTTAAMPASSPTNHARSKLVITRRQARATPTRRSVGASLVSASPMAPGVSSGVTRIDGL